ncbi:MAG: CAP domain-containing protein [Actinoplanes sp.]
MSAAARFRYTLVAGATAVVIGAGFTAVGMTRDAEAETTTATSADRPLAPVVASPATSDEAALLELLPKPTLSPSPSASVTPSVSASAKASASATPSTSKSAAKKRRTTPTKTATKKPSVPSTSGSVADQVLAHINAARAEEGLGALSLDTNLSKASAIHTQLMIDGCGLSHQCSGESGLGERFSAQDVKWSSAGENIGFGSSGSSDADKVKAANGLTDSMLAEVPPNDGHRKNLLNPGFKRIGLSIVRDSKGVTWMTQDFVN